jgi:serine/threonine protein kinase/tetratricopeptide (TPR) repeat protein
MSDPLTQLNAALEGRYRVQRELGEGGMATVYLADDLKHRRQVAVKVLRPELAAALGADRFLREIETTASLRHPHILPLFDSGDEQGVLFYVMPFVEGQTLRDLLDRERQLPLEDALRIVGSVADALSYAHGRGVIHRDIKPENILLENGHAVVADFGIAHAVSESGGDNLTRAGMVLGTPLYMSPEQANGESVDARSDIYSLGCVAYEVLAGTPPFNGPTALVVMARHALDPVPALRTTRPGVPLPVAEAVERALEKTPADRFETIQGWHDALLRPSGPVAPTSPEASGSAGASEPHAESGLSFSLSDRPSIAILPFKSMGTDSDQGFLADGIRFGIQATLVQLSGLFLVNASTLNLYRGKEMPAAVVGDELSVRYVLEGAVQQVGARIRVTVQLTDVETRRTIWAERYDRLVEDVFKLQDEITGEVISSLNVKLLSGELGRGLFATLTSPEAREYFYRGASYLYEGTKENNAAAREMFTELYRVQPESVTGPSNISVTHWLDAFQGWSDSFSQSVEQAAEWAEKAIEYEDNNGIGHAVLGHLRVLEHKYDEALAICLEGVQLRKSCPLAHGLLGLVLNYSGDAEGAVREVRAALQLEKVYPPWLLTILGAAYRDSGDVGLSISAVRESLRLDPAEMDALLVLCSDYQLAGKHDDAQRVAADVRDRNPTFGLTAYAERQPYKDPTRLDLVVQALRNAGLPD